MDNLLIMIKYGFDSLEEEIIETYKNLGWNLINNTTKNPITEEDAKVVWNTLKGKLFEGNYDYNKQGNVILLHLQKDYAEDNYKIAYKTKRELRAKYADKDNIFANVLHTSDNNERAMEEIKIFF